MQCCSFKCNLHDTGVKGTALTQREAMFQRKFLSRLSHAIKVRDQNCSVQNNHVQHPTLFKVDSYYMFFF